MKSERQAVAAAFQFLSRFPVQMALDFSPDLLKRSVSYYPLVGTAIGLVVWCFGAAISWVLPPFPAAVLILMIWVWMTGGLHLDGWMDSADALFSYRSRERMLEIMKDSRVGAMGVIACVLLLLLKVSLIYTILADGPVSCLLLLPMVWSRWFMVHAITGWPKARQGEGLAGQFQQMDGIRVRMALLWALGVTLCAAVADGIGYGLFTYPAHMLENWQMSGQLPWLGIAGVSIVLPLAAWRAGKFVADRISSRLEGLTGDVYGALNELLETLLLLLIVVIHSIG